MNPGIYGLGGQIVTPVQGPFAGVASSRTMLSIWALLLGGGGGSCTANPVRPAGGGGGGGVLENTQLGVMLQTNFTVSIGAGGVNSSNGYPSYAAIGNPTQFGTLVAVGGGQAAVAGSYIGCPGATGAGGIYTGGMSSIVSSQGYAGGASIASATANGGGGGAGAVGGDATSGVAGSGGAGRASAITGTTVFYGGGGGGGAYVGTSTAGAGGATGGGNGSSAVASAGSAGSQNLGGGGGGGACNGSAVSAGGAGGSGVVILRWNASQAVAILSSGLIATRTTVGTDTVLTITAGTGTISWS